MKIYFRKSAIKEIWSGGYRSKKFENLKIGRVQNENKNWKDIHLSINYYFNFKHDNFSNIVEYPIYTVISVKKGYVEIQELHKTQIIRFIANREYEAYILFDHDKYLPENKVYDQSTLFSYY